MDAEELCRTCLDTENVMVPLFEGGRAAMIPSGDGDTLIDLLSSVSGIKVAFNDGLPLQICTFCVDELQRSTAFQLKCRKSESTLLKLKEAKLLLVRIKSENTTAHFYNENSPQSEEFARNEVIDIEDDDDEESSVVDKYEDLNFDDDNPLLDSYESGFDMDVEMIENMASNELAEIPVEDDGPTDVDIKRESEEGATTTKAVESKKANSKVKISPRKCDSRIKSYQMISNEGELECPGCSEIFTKLDPLRKHMLESHTTGEMCYLCDSVSGNQVTDIWKHTIDHLPKRHMCGVCGKRFIKRNYLKAHFKLTHMGQKEIFQCKMCSKSFKTRSGISYHRQVAHAVDKPFACEICASRFPHIKLLRLHMLSYHTDGPPKCKFCGQVFNAYSTMMKHVRMHHKDNNKHKLNNAAQNSFKCAICSKCFVEKHTLEAHVISSHTNYRQFKCTHCPFSFKFKSVMETHIDAHHPNALPEGASNKCEICLKTLGSLKSLATHMANVHTSIRPYLCIFCSYSFKIESNLEAHINEIHSNRVGQIEYKCDDCDDPFNSRDELCQHKAVVHNESVQPYGNSADNTTDFIFRTMFE